MRHPAAPVALALATVLSLSACTGDGDSEEPKAFPEPSTTALAVYDAGRATVPRSDFCSLLDREKAELALGEKVTKVSSYADGDRIRIADGVTDVAHEYGCTNATASGDEAKAWVFAPPVAKEEARTLVKEAQRKQKGCTNPYAPQFGDPGVVTLCREPVAGGAGSSAGSSADSSAGAGDRAGDGEGKSGAKGRELTTATYSGLFVDAWLSCSVTTSQQDIPESNLLDRAGRWCVAVLEAARTDRSG